MRRFSNDLKVSIVHGDSSTQLSNILHSINIPCVFWLDGHYSSEFQLGNKYIITANGGKNTPILDELIQIKLHIVKNHVILIDDARLFKGSNDYPTKSELSNFVKENFPQHLFSIKKDIIRILPF